MDNARWRRIEDVFHTLADDPIGPERDARLTALCDGDEGLAAAVHALLQRDASLSRSDTELDRHVGLRLGSYEVGALVARGGMASVYLGQRADDQFHQRVAIKIMDVRLSDQALVAGFRAERQILAALEHPNLTRLIDGGVSSFDEPYLVMEYVDGRRIDEYCDAARLDLPARVRLFARACAGVAYAHRNLILHRDVKPSNILVTADGVPKVVDFGTAALLEPERPTTVSRAPLTPAYASPEQLTGQPVGTSTDQYSLGLVLYELLTGSPAVPHGTSLIGAMERAINGAEPPAPHLAVAPAAAEARGTTTAQLRRQLAGDLGTIVRKALSIDPAARYPSVEHFIEDLYRWLRGEPILGRPQSLWYRTSRFVARHRVSVGVAATLLLSLVAATVVSVQQARIANRESARARELNRFMTTMLSSANPSWVNSTTAAAASVTVLQALDGAAELIARNAPMDPDVEAEVHRVIGRTYTSLGTVDKAVVHLDRSLELSRRAGDSRGIAMSQSSLGSLRVARGDFKGGEALHREAMVYFRGPDNDLDPEGLAMAVNDLAIAIGYQRPGDPEAITLLREAVALGDRVGSASVPTILHNLSIQLVRSGKLDEGEAAVRDSLRRMNAQPKQSPERASVLRTLAVLLWQKGNYAEAEPLAREAVEFAIATRPPEHPLLPNNKAWWGRTLASLGDGERALAVSQGAYDGYARLRPAGHQDLALPLIGLGAAYRVLGRLPESERSLRAAEAIIRKHPAQRDRIADMAGELGLTLRALGKHEDAARLLQESHDILERAYGASHPLTQQAKARQ